MVAGCGILDERVDDRQKLGHTLYLVHDDRYSSASTSHDLGQSLGSCRQLSRGSRVKEIDEDRVGMQGAQQRCLTRPAGSKEEVAAIWRPETSHDRSAHFGIHNSKLSAILEVYYPRCKSTAQKGSAGAERDPRPSPSPPNMCTSGRRRMEGKSSLGRCAICQLKCARCHGMRAAPRVESGTWTPFGSRAPSR